MATRPQIEVLSGNSVDIINAIRNSATNNYRNYVPIATPDAESIKTIGAIIMDSPVLQNDFINTLVNRIGRVVVTSKMYENPIQMFKKGFLDFGETIEEIFVTLAKPFQFDPEQAETTVFRREIPDVRSAFHVMNYQKFYKVTISQDQLRQAFLSWEGVTDLIARITEQIYTGASYDEFLVMKYMIAEKLLEGRLYPVVYDSSDTKNLAKALKKVSNKMEFMSPNYNIAGVRNFALKDNQYLLINAEKDAEMDVDVLASAFNMDKAQFMGHRVLVDSFGELDIDRLAELFDAEIKAGKMTLPNVSQLTALDGIPAIIIDGDWFMIFDNLASFTENYNGEGLYWNYFYHVWKTFSISPFANGAMVLPSTPTVTSVTVSPASATLVAGARQQFTSAMVASDFAPKEVVWTTTAGEINGAGVLTLPNDIADGTEVTVTATSKYKPAVSGTATITIGGSVTAVTVSPSTKTMKANETQAFTAVVTGGGVSPSQAVTWTISSTTNATIDQATGVVTAKGSVTNNATATVTATSVQNTNVTGTATITFSTAA